MEKEFDIIVCGSGVGGLGAAALLAKAGKKVLVLEKKKNVGGRAATFKGNDGVTRSMGQHAMLDNAKYDDLLDRLEIDAYKEYFSDWRLFFEGKLQSLTEVLPLIPDRAGEDMMKIADVLNGELDLDALDDISAKEWLGSMTPNPFMHELGEIGTAIASTIPKLDQAAASMYVETNTLIMTGMMMWIAGNGMQEILEEMADLVKRRADQL